MHADRDRSLDGPATGKGGSPYRLPRALDAVEVRVLGCLIEKELSTPDAYPLSLNALTAAVNQRSNRDPVVDLSSEVVEEALLGLLPEVLVWRVRTSRVLRWQHNLGSKWDLDEADRAVLAELLLRGPQTPGALRSRCHRMHGFGELSAVEATLQRLAGSLGLVESLPAQPGQKEARWDHRLGSRHDDPLPSATAAAPVRATEPSQDRLEALERRVEELAAELAELRRSLAGPHQG